jgi:type 1 glutamine amidotransferase
MTTGPSVVVHDECTAQVKDLAVIDRVLKPHKNGLPAVVLHCGMHSYRSEGWPEKTPWFEFTGLVTTAHGPKKPIEIRYTEKDSPITKGLEDWKTGDEELYNNAAGKLNDTAKELSRGKQTYPVAPPGKKKKKQEAAEQPAGAMETKDFTVTWTNDYHGARVFATTIGHTNETVADPRYLDLVTRGMLWACGKLDESGKPMAGYEAKGK